MIVSIVVAALILVAVLFVGLVVIGLVLGMSKYGTPWGAFMKGYRSGKAESKAARDQVDP